MMLKKRFLMMGILTGLLVFSGRIAFCEESVKPYITLTANDSTQLEAVTQDPLVLFVHLYNPFIQEIKNQNRRNEAIVEKYTQTQEYQALSDKKKNQFLEKYKTMELPIFELGSNEKPVADLIQFIVKDQAANEVLLNIRSLAANDGVKKTVRLDDRQTFFVYFGVDAEDLSALPEGTYLIEAILDTTKEKGMWQGKVVSGPVTLSLKKGRSEERMHDLKLANYYRLDKQYSKLEATARKLLQQEPKAVGGLTYLGDALDGQEKSEEALEAFTKAEKLYYKHAKKYKPKVLEPPRYLTRRIREIQEKLGLVEPLS